MESQEVIWINQLAPRGFSSALLTHLFLNVCNWNNRCTDLEVFLEQFNRAISEEETTDRGEWDIPEVMKPVRDCWHNDTMIPFALELIKLNQRQQQQLENGDFGALGLRSGKRRRLN